MNPQNSKHIMLFFSILRYIGSRVLILWKSIKFIVTNSSLTTTRRCSIIKYLKKMNVNLNLQTVCLVLYKKKASDEKK